jgi:quinol monooxygenase YgiN
MSASLKEDGCRQYRFTADLENSQRFYLLELWADEEAFKGHIKGRPFKHFIASLGEFGRVIKSERLHGSLEPYEIQR